MVSLPFFPRRQEVPAAVVARRVESERMRRASAEKRTADLAAARERAATLGRITEPMTPRAQIAAEVAAERTARKSAAGAKR